MAYIKNVTQAVSYAKFRPSPPSELIEKIISFLNEKNKYENNLALDVGCGSGQSTKTLAPYFERVIGIDNSPDQLQQAHKNNELPNVEYREYPKKIINFKLWGYLQEEFLWSQKEVWALARERLGSAEELGESDGSVDLVTVGMALHWFHLGRFSAEVTRVLRDDGVLAVYGYNLPHPSVNGYSYASFWQSMLMERLDKYFPEGSKLAYFDSYRGEQYAKFSFSNFPTLRYEYLSQKRTSILELLGYVSSMSGYQNYLAQHGEPEAQALLDNFKHEFLNHIASQSDENPIDIVFPYYLLLSRKDN